MYQRSTAGTLRQCEILSGIVQTERELRSIGEAETAVAEIVHPFAIIVSQDCDLTQDFRARVDPVDPRQQLPTTLLCQLFAAEDLRGDLPKGRDLWQAITRNQNERYHYLTLAPAELDLSGNGLPDLIADFKRYFTVPTDEIYIRLLRGLTSRRCRLRTPFSENFNARFFNYQSRIALPAGEDEDPFFTQNPDLSGLLRQDR